MESEEIDIFVKMEDGTKYTVEVNKTLSYGELLEIIKEKIVKHYHFQVTFNGKKYTKANKNDKLNFNQGDTIYLFLTVINESFNANFLLNDKVDESDTSVNKVSGILQLCLLKYIAKNMNDSEIKKITSNEIRGIISDLKKEMDLTDDPQKDIKANLKQKTGNNLITYINYIDHIATEKVINYLISLLNENTKKQVMYYWSQISKYEELNQLFQKDFKLAIENSYFDYSLIGVSIYQQAKRKQFVSDFNSCDNRIMKFLFHGTQIDPVAKIITEGFLYTRKPFYGMGIYFSDMLDYISFYCGGETYEQRRRNFGKIMPAGTTFSCVATTIFYDRDKREDVYDFRYHIKELDHFPTYEEMKKNYKDKMVEKNGIHFARVEPHHGQVLKSEEIINTEKKKGKFIGNEYVITEKEQMLPLYGLTLKRNEYFVVWRDPNFVGENQHYKYLNNAKMILYKNENINVYIESSTEKALELIERKKYNKIILISSIGLDLGGKTFVETARKILGFDVMVLFFSANSKHLKWVQNFPNALYTDNTSFYKKYVKNYNKEGLLNLKKEIEDHYKIKLNFTQNFLEFPKYINNNKYEDIIFEEICPNFRKVIIKNKKNKKSLFLFMDGKDKTVKLVNQQDVGSISWYVTILDNVITLYSNGFYLDYNEKNNKVEGFQYTKRWKIEKEKEQYYFYYENKNSILTISGENVVVKNTIIKDDQLFYFIDENKNN